MNSKRVFAIPLFLIIVSSFCQCGSSKNAKHSGSLHEGYIVLSNKAFENVNSDGFPIGEYMGDDMVLGSSIRTMFIKDHYLIDVEITQHYENGIYTNKKDTTAYVFYDLDKQQLMCFETLAMNAKMLKRKKMNSESPFSRPSKYDPFIGVADSTWKIRDIEIDGKKSLIVEFISPYIEDTAIIRRGQFWIDPAISDFPIQISHLLSKKNNNGFVYKAQSVMPDEKAVMVMSFDYQPTKLPDSLINIIKKWAERMEEDK